MEKKAKFEVAGEIVEIGVEQTFSSGFTKRELVVETSKNDNYPSPVRVTFKKDDCQKLDTVNIGDSVEVTGFVEGRRWDGAKGTQFFIDLTAKSLMVTERAGLPGPDKDTPPNNWATLLAFGARFGEDEAKVKVRCEQYKEKNHLTRKFESADWKAIADEIYAKHSPKKEPEKLPDEDEMPF